MKAQNLLSIIIFSFVLLVAYSSIASTGKCTSGDCYDSVGSFNFPDDVRYAGEWKDGRKNGIGTMSFPEDTAYTRKLINDRQGRQVWTFPDGGRKSITRIGSIKIR